MKYNIKSDLKGFLIEDIGKGDITSALLSRKKILAKIITRESGIIAGTPYAKTIFQMKGCHSRILKKDGSRIRKNQIIMTITGNADSILTCERTVLNLLSRMSGIATQTNVLVRKVPKKVKILATRKTAPGLRYFDKEAVQIGGGQKHRMKLDEMIMIKDNHIAAENSLLELIKRAKKKYKKFEVEVENQNDALVATREGATIIMLDNFYPAQIRKTIQVLKEHGLRKRVVLEASGGINAENISQYGKTGVDVISIGSITNSVKGIDLSLEI